jgi:hypothetical protein
VKAGIRVGGELITKLIPFTLVALPRFESTTSKERVVVPATVGVPDTTPSKFIASPVGNGFDALTSKGALPESEKLNVSGTPTVPVMI